MNLIEIVRKLKPRQRASSFQNQTTIEMSSDSTAIHYIVDGKHVNYCFAFNSDEWSADDWEIEVKYVDFWTAWQARINDKKKIRSEYWHKTVHIDINFDLGSVNDRLTENTINGRWQILD